MYHTVRISCITLTLLLFRGEKLSPVYSLWRRPPDIILVLLDIVVTNFFLLDWPCATVILVLHSLHQIMLGYGIYFLYLNNLIRLIVQTDCRVLIVRKDVWRLEHGHCDWKQARWWNRRRKQRPPGWYLSLFCRICQMGQYIEKTTCVEKDSRNITGIIKPRRQTYADSAFQRMSMSRWTWPGGRGWQSLLRRNMGQEETLRYLVYPALCEVLLYKTHLNQISERNELKHGKAGSRDWGAQPQEGKLCA